MADLVFLGSLLTFFAFVESKVTTGASSVYSSGRKLTPPALDKILTSIESTLSSFYEPTKAWVEEKGSLCVEKVDEAAVRWYSAAKEKCSSVVPETFHTAHDYWLGACEDVSNTWKEQGVIQGTAGIMGGVFGQLKDFFSTTVGEAPLVKDTMETVEGSTLFVRSKEHFESSVQPILTKGIGYIKRLPECATDALVFLAGYMEGAKEKVESATDFVVAQPAYSKGLAMTSSVLAWVTGTSLFATVVEKVYVPYLERYVSPITTTITESDAYGAIVDRLTPIKQE
ncbi:hypothetical protein BSKO_04141 [Bryopsis sp. KO-2023]|nr:hypothetical protein BSKO_04141 [Bryopsis sp. KO-2023]